jgi:hypothetical protein
VRASRIKGELNKRLTSGSHVLETCVRNIFTPQTETVKGSRSAYSCAKQQILYFVGRYMIA